MQNTSDLSALMHDTRSIYIAIAALVLLVRVGQCTGGRVACLSP